MSILRDFAAIMVVGVALVVRADVVESVECFLAEHRLNYGYDAKSQSCVLIGSAEKKIAASVSSPAFLAVRNSAVRVAELNARAELMRVVSSTISGERTDRQEANGVNLRQTTKSLVELFSNEPLYGCETVCVREERDGEWVRVAVAMRWSAEAEREARAAKSGDLNWDILSVENEWKIWAETFDFSRAGSFASFVGSDGIRRWVGIGYADLERGPRVVAERLARQNATAGLAYSLFGESETQSVANRIFKEISQGSDWSEATIVNRFDNMVSQAVKGKIIRDSEVFTTTIVHPLSGRKLFVSVAGINPRDLAEMKLLESSDSKGFPIESQPHLHDVSSRPDHGELPMPNRPDHSFRQLGNRPEHP